jgi:signal transduction histidine kinase
MPKTQRLISLLLLALLFASCKQKTVTQHDSQNDSVKKYLDLANSDTVQYHDKVKYNDKAYSFINLKRNDSLTRKFLYQNIFCDRELHRIDKIIKKAKILEQLSIAANDNCGRGQAIRFYGLYYMLKSDNIKAISYYFKAAKILKSIERFNYYAVMLDIAVVQYYANDFQNSINTSLETIKEVKEEKVWRKDLIQSCFTENIAESLLSLKQYKQSLEYCDKLKSFNVKGSDYNVLVAHNYFALKDYKKANIHLDKVINNKNTLCSSPGYYYFAISLKTLYNRNKLNRDVLINTLLNVEKELSSINDVFFRNTNFKHLSICYAQVKDTNNAIQAAKKAVALSKEYKNAINILECLNQLIQVDQKNASKYGQEYIRINDSMQIAERRFRDKFARIAFETDEITLQKDKAVQRTWWLAGAFSVAVFIGLLLFLVYHQRTKQKKLRHQQQQEQANQEIYQLMLSQQTKEEEARQSEKKRIAQELHDGVMNKLASTRLNLSVLRNEKNPALIEKAQPFIEGIYNIEQEIRAIAHGLNNQMFLESNSFTRVLQDFVEQQNQIQQAQYTLEIDSNIDWNTISEAIKMNLYRIIQEASANANKFAQAQHVTISFVKDQNNLCFSIFDDGKGFDPELTHNGIGIKNMKERVAKLNGKLLIHSTIGKNTMISGVVPIG